MNSDQLSNQSKQQNNDYENIELVKKQSVGRKLSIASDSSRDSEN